MKRSDISDKIVSLLKAEGNKASEKVALICLENTNCISVLVQHLENDDKALKHALIKTFAIVSKKLPSALYPHFAIFSDLMLDNDKVMQWNAIDIVANMAEIDEMDYFDQAMIQRYLILLEDDSMITASHAVDNLWKIAKSKKWTQRTISDRLVKIDKIKRRPECTNILTGKAIQTFSRILTEIPNKNQVLGFVERQLNNPRPATAKKAELFMNRYLKLK